MADATGVRKDQRPSLSSESSARFYGSLSLFLFLFLSLSLSLSLSLVGRREDKGGVAKRMAVVVVSAFGERRREGSVRVRER